MPSERGRAGERHERDIAAPGRDRLQRMADMHIVGGAAGIGRIDMAELQAHVLDHRQAAEARRIARSAEIAVDVALAQSGIVERALGDLGMQLRQRRVWRFSRRVLVGPDDVGFALENSFSSNLLRSRATCRRRKVARSGMLRQSCV